MWDDVGSDQIFLSSFIQIKLIMNRHQIETEIWLECFPLICNVSSVLCACRLIYWLCLSLGSTIRGLGFGLSFLPIMVMLGVNLYYVCSSVGEGSVFDVEQPTMAPPPRQRWWGWRAEATLRDKQLWRLFNIVTLGQTTWLVILVSFEVVRW